MCKSLPHNGFIESYAHSTTSGNKLCGRLSFENSSSRTELFFWLAPEFRNQGIMNQDFKIGFLENIKSTKNNF